MSSNFIISLKDEQRDLGVAKPFLYKLQQERQLRFLHTNGAMEEKLEEAYIYIKKFLSIRPTSRWTVFFLLDIPNEGNNPISDSITAKWLLIRKLILERLNNFNLPQKVSLILVDNNQNRVASTFKEEHYSDLCFDFDANGFSSHQDINFIKNKEVQELDDIWSAANINIKNENVSSIEHLSAHLCQKAWTAFNNISEYFLNSLEQVELNQYTINNNFSILDKPTFERLKSDFISQIQYLKEHPIEWGHFSPSRVLKETAKKYLSLFNDLHPYDFHLLRFEIDSSDRYAQSFFKLKMALLINLLVGKSKLISELDKQRSYRVKLDLDLNQLATLTAKYRESMHYLSAYLPKQKGLPVSYKLKLRLTPDLEGTSKLKDTDLKPARLKAFKTNRNDHQDLEDWLSANKTKLLSIEEQIPTILGTCYKKSQAKPPEYITKELNLEEVDRFEKEINKHYTLEKKELSNVLAAEGWIENYQKKTEERLPELRKLLLRRPSVKTVFWSILGVLFLLNLPLLIDIFENGDEAFTRELGFTFLFSILLVFGVFYYTVILVQQKIKRILGYIFSDAQQVKRQFTTQFSQQKDYLSKLLHLNTLRHNKIAVDQLQAKIKEEKLQLDYHKNALSEHAMLSSKLASLFEQQETPSINHKKLDQTTLVLDKPDFKNEAYWLDSIAQQSYKGTIAVKIQLAKKRVSSPYAQLMHIVEFKEDSLF